jgi:hypothetical protein
VLGGDDDVKPFRGADVEMTGFGHKQDPDSAQLAEVVHPKGNPDNTVHVGGRGGSGEDGGASSSEESHFVVQFTLE